MYFSKHLHLTGGALVAAGLLAAALTGCSSSTTNAAASRTSAGANYPVKVDVCGSDVTFDKAPTAAVTNDINTFEDMAALGLEPSMVGTFGLDGYGTDGNGPVPTRDAAAYAKVKAVSPKYITLEPLVALKPDFLFAGWNYGLKVGSTLTPENLSKYGIKTYVLKESCAHVQSAKHTVTIDDTYTDLTNLGAIFGVQKRAATLVAAMKAKVASVQAKIAGSTPVKVFLYDSGTDSPFTSPGLAMPNALITLGGGQNTMGSLQQTWTSVSWEQAVATQPDCIIVNDYSTPTYEQKVAFLKSSPITKNLPAVTKNCFIRLDYGQLTPSPENADAVETIAKALHPDKF